KLAKVAELADAPDSGSGAARRAGSSPALRTHFVRAQDGEEAVGVDRFDEVGVEAGGGGCGSVGCAAVAGEGDEADLGVSRIAADAARDLETVEVRQADVHDRDVR